MCFIFNHSSTDVFNGPGPWWRCLLNKVDTRREEREVCEQHFLLHLLWETLEKLVLKENKITAVFKTSNKKKTILKNNRWRWRSGGFNLVPVCWKVIMTNTLDHAALTASLDLIVLSQSAAEGKTKTDLAFWWMAHGWPSQNVKIHAHYFLRAGCMEHLHNT